MIKSPVRGTVFDLGVRSGSVAKAAEPLLKVVPDEALSARVYLPSSAIGFIQPGQNADISLDTFPSADYGRLPAKVEGLPMSYPEEQRKRLGTEARTVLPGGAQPRRQTLQPAEKIPCNPAWASLRHPSAPAPKTVASGFFEDKLRSLAACVELLCHGTRLD